MLIKEIKVKNIITKSNLPKSDYCANPYVGCSHACKYCYASFMKMFTNHTENWGEFIDIKNWEKIDSPKKYNGKTIFIGSVTDPYNPFEEKYNKTRELLKQLQGTTAKITLQTKSDLILRDLDLIKSFPNIRVGFSINTLDENFKNDMDKAVSIEKRLRAMKKFYDSNIETVCFISPIFPEITDVKGIINKVKDQCDLIWIENLNLRGDYKIKILNFIKYKYPELFPLYNDIYNLSNTIYWENLETDIKNFAREQNLKYVINEDNIKKSLHSSPTIVNFFYHEQIKKTACKKSNSKNTYKE